MAFHVGDVVELTADVTTEGFLGTRAAKGTRGVVLKEPGLLTSTYRVRLDPDGKEADVAESGLKKPGGWWS